MAGKLIIKPIFNSVVNDIFGFKTCCGARAFDQNLELLVSNPGDAPVTVPSRCELAGPGGRQMIEHLMPHGPRTIGPGETAAFYCTLDETRWRGVRCIAFFDSAGGRHVVQLEAD
jgi:hypothetical protein